VWRHLHPQGEGVYTVWEERTSARAFNVVSTGCDVKTAFLCHRKAGNALLCHTGTAGEKE
jgi:hypothetical protein